MRSKIGVMEYEMRPRPLVVIQCHSQPANMLCAEDRVFK